MSPDFLNAFAATMSALAAFAALVVAWLSLRQSKATAAVTHRQMARAMDDSLQARLDPMYPHLRRVLGYMEDGVPREIRHVLIPFFVLYSDAFAAQRDGLLDKRDWEGFANELAYWSQKPTARRAWAIFRQQTWTAGFKEHVDSVLAGPPAYPDVVELSSREPEVAWPSDAAR